MLCRLRQGVFRQSELSHYRGVRSTLGVALPAQLIPQEMACGIFSKRAARAWQSGYATTISQTNIVTRLAAQARQWKYGIHTSRHLVSAGLCVGRWNHRR